MSLPRLKRSVKPSGTVLWYHRAPGGKLTRLPGNPETDAEAHAAWLAADRAQGQTGPVRQPRSLGALCAAYLASAAFARLAEATRGDRRRAIRRVLRSRAVEDAPVAGLAARHVEADLRPLTPQAARNRLKLWRALAAQAVALGWRRDDFAVGVARAPVRETPHRAPQPGDIEALRETWPLGTQQRLAIELLYHHAPRRADLVQLGRQHIRRGVIAWRQSKTGTWTTPVPLAAEARAALDAFLDRRPGVLTFLETERGTPRTAKGAGQWWHRTVAAAGLDGLPMHGFRHGLGRDLAEGNASDAAINLALGHSQRSTQGATYRQQAEAGRLMTQATETLSRTRGGTRPADPVEPAAENSDAATG